MKWDGRRAEYSVSQLSGSREAVEKEVETTPRVNAASKEVRLYLGDGQWKKTEEVNKIIKRYTKSFSPVYDRCGIVFSEDTNKYCCIPNDLTPIKEPE